MGNLIFTCSSSSRENTSARISDSSTWSPQAGQYISIRTLRELNQAQMSSLHRQGRRHPKTETSLIMEFSKSMEDQLEEVAKLPTTHMPRQSTQGPKLRPSIYSRRKLQETFYFNFII
uniref:AC4 protein n=1 Tax=Okra enation leaf curl virus TaxID=908125 RepID=A0A0M4AZ30_9GEMI|nr:AC4 protein [Okra enation leaf curl virus]